MGSIFFHLAFLALEMLEGEELYIIPSHWDYIKQQEVHYKYSTLKGSKR